MLLLFMRTFCIYFRVEFHTFIQLSVMLIDIKVGGGDLALVSNELSVTQSCL